jgi:autotransporter passenger strand-loop-strand repeat protein
VFVFSGATITGLVVEGGEAGIDGGTASNTVVEDGGVFYPDSGGVVYDTTVTSSGSFGVDSTGKAISSIVGSGGLMVVFSGGTTSATTISGGTLELSGGTVAGGIKFAGTSGALVDSALPSAAISGFTAGSGDSITLGGIAYVSGATVTVAKANVVTISNGGKTYNLTIEGATVGETDFHFSSGSVLTRGAAPAQMAFLRPAAAAAPASGLWSAPGLEFFAGRGGALHVAANASVSLASSSTAGGARYEMLADRTSGIALHVVTHGG